MNQRSELIIHGKVGKIIDKDSYSNDQCILKVKNIKDLKERNLKQHLKINSGAE
ncbi:MAG TPA: hypothetical protein PLD63_12265 [Ignavibacteria bacterium]|nr:hypothetical protein [Ignavibacteria bacterium]